MRYIIILALIFTFAVYLATRIFNNQSKVDITTNQTPAVSYNLPENWSKTDAEPLELKFEKNTSGFKPQLGLSVSKLSDNASFSAYTQQLVAGLRSTVPTFRISSQKLSDRGNGPIFDLSGSYLSKSGTILVIQKVYFINNQIYTLTGSYTKDTSTPDEINQIFQSIYDQKITPSA